MGMAMIAIAFERDSVSGSGKSLVKALSATGRTEGTSGTIHVIVTEVSYQDNAHHHMSTSFFPPPHGLLLLLLLLLVKTGKVWMMAWIGGSYDTKGTTGNTMDG